MTSLLKLKILWSQLVLNMRVNMVYLNTNFMMNLCHFVPGRGKSFAVAAPGSVKFDEPGLSGLIGTGLGIDNAFIKCFFSKCYGVGLNERKTRRNGQS